MKAPEALRSATPAGTRRNHPRFGFGGRFFRWRNALGTFFALFLVLFPWGRTAVPTWQAAAGLALLGGGVALRLWSIRQIGGAARKTSRLKAVRLITWGPFAVVRNPIYVANISVFAGFALLSGLAWSLPLVVGGLGVWYNALVRREETFLRASFPVEYRDYARRTSRWLPSLRWCPRPRELPTYPFVRALHRERSHLLAVAGGVFVFLLLPLLYERSALTARNPTPAAVARPPAPALPAKSESGGAAATKAPSSGAPAVR